MAVNLIDSTDIKVVQSGTDIDLEFDSTNLNNIIDGRIDNAIESGSNENGSYLKFSDGTMICYLQPQFTKDITNQYEGIYYANSGEILFPQTFYANPIINITLLGIAGGGYSFYNIYTDKFSGFFWKIQSKSNVTFSAMITAYGRWKA